MKKILIFVYAAFFVIMLANFIYYKNLYNTQINYITTLLDRQVQIVGLSVDSANNSFTSDLTEISFSEDLALFFINKTDHDRTVEKMKLFFSKYQDFVTGIKFFDINRNEFSLKKDELSNEWLQQDYVLHVQGEILRNEVLVEGPRKFTYYLPVFKDNVTIGNIVVEVDYNKYFYELFSEFNLKDYQWQWVVSDSGAIIYENSEEPITYNRLTDIVTSVESGSVGNIYHSASISGERKEIISSYYSTQLLRRNLGLVFSASTGFFQKYIIRNSIFIVAGTLLLIQLIIFLFWKHIRSQKSESKRLSDSEKMLFRLIEEMPVGVIIHNKNREIIKANKVAATQYSYPSETEMTGKIFPDTSAPDSNDYFSKNLGNTFNPEQFVIIKKEIGEIVLYRNSIPAVFMGEEANMEILIDVTMLESARKQEAKANVAKSEFLARMSYEIRTPLNGIIGITDILNKKELTDEVRGFIDLLRRSTEVLLNIINDILDFSKIETGKMILDEIPFNLREEISFCTGLAKTYIADNDVDFTYTVNDDVPENIIADPYRLRQVLTNLIHNSAKNTNGGEIRLTCGLKSKSSGIITLDFELADTGQSFDKATLKKIFGDFINIESKAVKSNDESGFGTILAKQLVELMGGELFAECPSGLSGDTGTKVRFTINAYSNERLGKNINQEKITSFDSIKTLVITGIQNRDEELLSALHKLGLNVSLTAFNKSTVGQVKANLAAPTGKYNLVIITDDKDFDGFDAARQIWENNLSGRVIMLLVSSNDRTGNYLRCITMGIDHYLVKPFDLNELSNQVRDSFPFIDTLAASTDISNLKSDIRILIVEDNKMNQKVIGTMLNVLGYSFDISEDGYEGYMKARENHYDLIFMDLIMPEMNGYDSARKILTFDKDVLIVAFTADNMPDAKAKAELSGIREFISKPVRMDELKRFFAKHFRKNEDARS